MGNTVPDDISALFKHAGVDPHVYQQFAHPRISPATRTAPQPPVALPEPNQIVPTSPVQVDSANAAPDRPPFSGIPGESSAAGRWQVLWNQTGPRAGAIGAEARPIQALAFHSVAGGGGATTILATLARAFSRLGERVLVSDSSEFSTMPLYFGVQSLVGGSNTIVVQDGLPIHLELRSSGVEPNQTEAQVDEECFWSGLDRTAGQIDRVLLEVFRQQVERTGRWLRAHGAAIVVMTPDMRSAVGVQRLARYFRERESVLGGPILKYFLLNKFDPRSKLDNDMRQWLSGELGDILVPVAIRRDQKVEDALAQGLTVLDYAPGSDAAEDFRQLVEWLRRMHL